MIKKMVGTMPGAGAYKTIAHSRKPSPFFHGIFCSFFNCLPARSKTDNYTMIIQTGASILQIDTPIQKYYLLS